MSLHIGSLLVRRGFLDSCAKTAGSAQESGTRNDPLLPGAGTWRPVRRQGPSTPASTFSPVATMNSSRTDSYSVSEACDIGFHPGIFFLPTPRVVGAAGKAASVLTDIPPDHEGGSQASVNLAHARVCPLACHLKNACLPVKCETSLFKTR